MLDAIARIPFDAAERRLLKVEEAIARQRGWNPARDAALPVLEAETARLRARVADQRAAWLAAPGRRNTVIVGSVFGLLAIVAALLGYSGLVPSLGGVAIGFVVFYGPLQGKGLLKPLLPDIGDLEAKTFVTVEVVQPASA